MSVLETLFSKPKVPTFNIPQQKAAPAPPPTKKVETPESPEELVSKDKGQFKGRSTSKGLRSLFVPLSSSSLAIGGK